MDISQMVSFYIFFKNVNVSAICPGSVFWDFVPFGVDRISFSQKKVFSVCCVVLRVQANQEKESEMVRWEVLNEKRAEERDG